MSKGTEVILITADARLREMVCQHRPPGVGLHCLLPAEVSDRELTDGSEVWLDLDAPVTADLPTTHRRVYFHSHNSLLPRGLPPGLYIRKPCNDTVMRVLWSGVPATAATDATPARRRRPGLPEWIMEFHELGLRELCRRCASRLPARLGYADVSLYLYDQDQALLTLAETSHKRPIDLAVRVTDDQTSLMAIAARSGRPIKTTNLALERQRRGLSPPQDGRTYPDGTCLVAPLVSGGRLWGVLNLSGAARGPATEDDVPLETLLAFIGRSLRFACAYDRARTEARVDALTGLYNQRWMMETLIREIRRSQRFQIPLSLIVVDLDDLKGVNDRHGHPAGDCMLRHVASRVTKALRQFDSAARVGGDEFIILLPATDMEGARQVARRILASIRSEPATHQGVPLPVRASVGIAQWRTGWEAAQLVEAADQAMYMAKRQGRDQIVCWPQTAEVVHFKSDATQRTWSPPAADAKLSRQTQGADSEPEAPCPAVPAETPSPG